MKFKPTLYTLTKASVVLLVFACLVSCKKSKKGSDTDSSSSTANILKFSATAADTAAKLTIQIYDTNTNHIYYSANTGKYSYTGQYTVDQSSSITFVASASKITNVSAQIVSNNNAVAVGNYSAPQDQGLPPVVTLYYKIP